MEHQNRLLVDSPDFSTFVCSLWRLADDISYLKVVLPVSIDYLINLLARRIQLNNRRSFLDGRTQQVVLNGAASSVEKITSGVPQGSVLGPLLFLLYTADIPLIAHVFGLGVHCYADDG